MKSLDRFFQRLDKLDGNNTKDSDFWVFQVDHCDGKGPGIIRVWEMRGREFVRDLSPQEYQQILDKDKGTVLNVIESDRVRA